MHKNTIITLSNRPFFGVSLPNYIRLGRGISHMSSCIMQRFVTQLHPVLSKPGRPNLATITSEASRTEIFIYNLSSALQSSKSSGELDVVFKVMPFCFHFNLFTTSVFIDVYWHRAFFRVSATDQPKIIVEGLELEVYKR